jgi:hypothetical protein
VIELPAEIVGLFADAVAEALTPVMVDPTEIAGAVAAAELVVAVTAATFAFTGAGFNVNMYAIPEDAPPEDAVHVLVHVEHAEATSSQAAAAVAPLKVLSNRSVIVPGGVHVTELALAHMEPRNRPAVVNEGITKPAGVPCT